MTIIFRVSKEGMVGVEYSHYHMIVGRSFFFSWWEAIAWLAGFMEPDDTIKVIPLGQEHTQC